MSTMKNGNHRPRFQVAPAPGKGLGVYATKPIKEGKFLLSFRASGPLLSYEDTKKGDWESHCLQIGIREYIWVKKRPQCYINHSCDPNAGLRDGTELHALRDIEAGEEITFDYSTTMDEDDWEMDCRCGSPNCRHWVRDFRHLPRDTQSRYEELGIVGTFCTRPRSAPTDHTVLMESRC